MTAKRFPVTLGTAGRSLWRDVTGDYDLRADELRLLEQACGELDVLAALGDAMRGADLVAEGSQGQPVAHPLLAEVRAHRLLLARLLDQLGLPDGPGRDEVSARRARSALGRAGARARWS